MAPQNALAATFVQAALEQEALRARTVFIFSGEGVHSADTDASLLRASRAWPAVLQAIQKLGHEDAEAFLLGSLGQHAGPCSTVATVAVNILNAELWRQWGQSPDVVVGHSIGEVAAACVAGMLSVEDAIRTAHTLGAAMAETPGAMLHTELPRKELANFPLNDGLSVAAVNYVVQRGDVAAEDLLSVTLCGHAASVVAFVAQDPGATKLKPEHPWHHPTVSRKVDLPTSRKARCTFISACAGTQLSEVGPEHWEAWLRTPVRFEEALAAAAVEPSSVIEMGAHPVMAAAVRATFGTRLIAYACSMRRGEPGAYVRSQRAALPGFAAGLQAALRGFSIDLPRRGGFAVDYDADFADQGIESQQLVLLAAALAHWFPNLAAHDLYRFTSLKALVYGWQDAAPLAAAKATATGTALEVLGCATRLPAGINSPADFMGLLEKDDQSAAFSAVPVGAPPAAFLCPRFDQEAALAAAEGIGCEGAEALALDPQHALALALAEQMWQDAGERAASVARARPERVGVYIGAWQPVAASGGKASAYRTIGSSLSALAARVANAYNLQGPCHTVNTACSSALVAVDTALRDAKAGRIDFAIVGGVNLFGDDQTLFADLRRAGMLSRTARCHTFSSKADGYVRGEGGVLFLLHAGSDLPSRARILGSAVTQNSTRKPLSAVDPIAQERVIREACADAGVQPSQLAAVEMHGTGTPLGDPVEVSALARVTAGKEGPPCVMTAAKMHVGHLESAAGGVGLLKAVLMCEQRRVPSFAVDGGLNPQVTAAMEGSRLAAPGMEATLSAEAIVGVSSFGFAGSNAHVVVAQTPGARALPRYDVAEPMEATKAKAAIPSETEETASPSERLETSAPSPGASSPRSAGSKECPEATELVAGAVAEISGHKGALDPDVAISDIGVDSLGLAELLGRLEDCYGANCISIDMIMDRPTVRAIAGHLAGLKAVALKVPSQAAAVPQPTKALSPARPKMASRARGDLPVPSNADIGCTWVRTTHVGSLPRPADGNIELSNIIDQQLAAGISVVNDGEWTRENYIADVINRIEGLRGGADQLKEGCCEKHAMPVADDMRHCPQFCARFTGGNGLITLNPKREAVSDLACVAHPRYVRAAIPGLEAFLASLASMGQAPGDAFYSVPSPGTLALFCKDIYFQDHAAYVCALGEALAGEFAQIAASGLQLQVDCPDLAMGRHTRWVSLDDAAFLEVAKLNVEALNNALRDVPVEQVRVHMCWGNYAGPHHKDMPADLIWPILGTVKAKYLLVEGANPRHRADVVAFEKAVKLGHFGDGQVIVPGLIDTTAARVESPDLIADSLLRYICIAGHPSRVMAGTDCGFASTAKSTAITSDIVWMKLESLAEGARLATTRYLQLEAPVPCRAPIFKPTPFRAAVIASRADADYAGELAAALRALRAHSVELVFERHFEAVRWTVDVPLVLVGVGDEGTAAAARVLEELAADASVARRPATVVSVGASKATGVALPRGPADEVAAAVSKAAVADNSFDKRRLVLPRSSEPPRNVDVVVVGAGLLGMVTAKRCLDAGFSVAMLEQRPLVGGIWSMYANGTSQVNSSEGGYCIKEFIGEEGGKNGDNRDHSTAAEVLRDFAKLGESLQQHIYTGVKVVKILGKEGDYTVLFEDGGGSATNAGVAGCRGVVLCINDRVGLPRPLAAPGREQFEGVVADGTADSLAGVDWRGKRVVIAGMGAFAVENVRTALENGAAEVTVVGRRHGTICPKAIDYLNFVKPWDANYKHDTNTNVKQFLKWKALYAASGCTVPECWPKQVKHDGHTISVSDVWFIGHFMKKLSTRKGEIARIEPAGVVVGPSNEFIPCDIVVGCIGFERSNYLCEALTGRNEVKTTNYLDRDMMYLADAEIDEGAFNSFFGSSVLEYGKFFSNIFVEGLKRGDELGEMLWGADTASVPIGDRKWSQYIASGAKLIKADEAIARHAREQVDRRAAHFWRTLPPQSFLETNRKEWEELHQRLNGGVPVPKEKQLPYFFEEAPRWC